jgi:hypothetical protein
MLGAVTVEALMGGVRVWRPARMDAVEGERVAFSFQGHKPETTPGPRMDTDRIKEASNAERPDIRETPLGTSKATGGSRTISKVKVPRQQTTRISIPTIRPSNPDIGLVVQWDSLLDLSVAFNIKANPSSCNFRLVLKACFSGSLRCLVKTFLSCN